MSRARQELNLEPRRLARMAVWFWHVMVLGGAVGMLVTPNVIVKSADPVWSVVLAVLPWVLVIAAGAGALIGWRQHKSPNASRGAPLIAVAVVEAVALLLLAGPTGLVEFQSYPVPFGAALIGVGTALLSRPKG